MDAALKKAMIIGLVLLLLPVVTLIIGAITYGGVGAFFGLVIGLVSRWFFKRTALRKLSPFTKALEGADIEVVQFAASAPGKFLEGDEELSLLLPVTGNLTIRVNPKGSDSWQPGSLRLEVADEILKDIEDHHKEGYGMYVFSYGLDNSDGAAPDQNTVRGMQKARFHIAAGEKVSRVRVFCHFSPIGEIMLPKNQ